MNESVLQPELAAQAEADLIDAAGVARLLSLTQEEVYRLTARGKLPQPAVKLTKRTVRWRRADIEALIGQPDAA
jgi:predicted DNA-binding transcriptional regulator AlpA